MLEQRHRIQLTPATHIAGDPSRTPEKRMLQDARHCGAFGSRSLVSGEVATGVSQLLAESLSIAHGSIREATFPACVGTRRYPRTVRFKWDRNGAEGFPLRGGHAHWHP